MKSHSILAVNSVLTQDTEDYTIYQGNPAKEIRKRETRAKIIMVTAVNEIDKINEAKDWGAIEYITKPLLLEELEKSVVSLASTIK